MPKRKKDESMEPQDPERTGPPAGTDLGDEPGAQRSKSSKAAQPTSGRSPGGSRGGGRRRGSSGARGR